MKNKFGLVGIVGLVGFVAVASFSIIGFISVREKAKDNDRKIEEFREKYQNNEDYDLEGYSVKVGYLSNTGNINTVLKDYVSFKSFFYKNSNNVYDGTGNIVSSSVDEILNKYDEEFFKEKSLAVKYISVSSGGITIEKVYGEIDGETVKITYEENIPEVGTTDMSGYFLIVEVSKDIKEVI